ncbi:MAG: DNA repair protein RecO [Clostridia bacterium]|nr:DNA repair protein RecO [Clostridia bacterium]
MTKCLQCLPQICGKISCSARGARKPNSSMLAGTQFLGFSEYILYKGRNGIYSINSCEPIEIFYNLRIDLDKLQYASYIAKIVEDITNENDSAYNILKLLLNTIYTISETETNMELALSIFKIRLLALIGFVPNILSCTNCARKENITHFSIKDNGIKCEACAKQDKSVIKINEATLYAIRYIIMADAKKIFSFSVPDASIEELKLISKVYLEEKLEKSYKFDKII